MNLSRKVGSLTLVLLMLVAAGCQRCRPASMLSINFGGTVAFVLANADDAQKGHSDYMTALAVRDNSIGHAHLGKHLGQDVGYFAKAGKAPVPAHYAFLRVKARNLCVGLEGSCDASPQLGDTAAYYHLDGVNMKVEDLVGDGGVKLLLVDAIPRLGTIAPGYSEGLGQVCTECLNGDSDDLRRVAARFRFAHEVFHPTKVAHPSKALYFHDLGTGDEKPVPYAPQVPLFELATLDAEIHSDIVRVDLVPLPGGGGTEQHFRLHAAPGEKNIVIDLFDAPASDILCRDSRCEGIGYPSDGETVSHFDLFYALSKNREVEGTRFVLDRQDGSIVRCGQYWSPAAPLSAGKFVGVS